ncbi:MAG TPA: hypothetical protein VNJ31_04765 [Methyloceanibacter sp.]|nr:hypothetical protein [Methyloceanibacter sp.]
MTNQSESEQSAPEAGSQQAACKLAEEIAPLVRQARASGHDFLAYLLAMALNEARRLAGH